MTINAPAAVLLLLYELVGEEQGVPSREAARHGPERHAQGVHGARQLHLPARADDAADHRHLRVLPASTCRSGTRSRSPATTSARRAARRCRRSRSRSPTRSPTSRRRSTRGLEVDDFAPRLAFFFNGHNNVFQEVAKFRAARRMWAEIMRDRFGAENPRSQMIRFHTQTGGVTLQAQQPEVQHRPRRAAGLRRGLRRHAVAAHQRLRRGAGAADRALGADRAAHAAGHRPRVRRRRHRRPVRRLLLRRVADRRDRAARQGADGARSRRWAARSRRSSSCSSEIEESASSYHERYKSGQDIVVGVNKYVDRHDRRRRHPQGRPRGRAAPGRAAQEAQGEPRPGCGRRTTRRARATSPARDGNLLPPMKEALARRALRSARSAAPCATCSASTRAGPSSRSPSRSLARIAHHLDLGFAPLREQLAPEVAQPSGRGRHARPARLRAAAERAPARRPADRRAVVREPPRTLGRASGRRLRRVASGHRPQLQRGAADLPPRQFVPGRLAAPHA